MLRFSGVFWCVGIIFVSKAKNSILEDYINGKRDIYFDKFNGGDKVDR